MIDLVCPKLTVSSVRSIDGALLTRQGIRGIIIDLDNTIVPWGSPAVEPEVHHWLASLQQNGFKICLLSNSQSSRARDIARKLGIAFVSPAYKPAKSGFRRAIAALCLSPREIAVIGDQIYTDILGGNRVGLFTIWVKPISKREFIGTKLTRQLEKLTVWMLKSKGLIKHMEDLK
jgi:HAD superfamily phosphatase (TIGR01668 family)